MVYSHGSTIQPVCILEFRVWNLWPSGNHRLWTTHDSSRWSCSPWETLETQVAVPTRDEGEVEAPGGSWGFGQGSLHHSHGYRLKQRSCRFAGKWGRPVVLKPYVFAITCEHYHVVCWRFAECRWAGFIYQIQCCLQVHMWLCIHIYIYTYIHIVGEYVYYIHMIWYVYMYNVYYCILYTYDRICRCDVWQYIYIYTYTDVDTQ